MAEVGRSCGVRCHDAAVAHAARLELVNKGGDGFFRLFFKCSYTAGLYNQHGRLAARVGGALAEVRTALPPEYGKLERASELTTASEAKWSGVCRAKPWKRRTE